MSNKFVMPVKGKYGITSPFGWRKDPVTKKNTRHHNGADIVTGRKDEPVLAVMNGRIVKAQKSTAKSGGFGYYVVVRHFIDGKFYTSLYAHMKANSFKVRVGQLVKAGDQLGIMGTTGYSTGVHLHLEIWKGRTHGWSADGKGFVEPISFLEAMDKAAEAKSFAKVASPKPKTANPVPDHLTGYKTSGSNTKTSTSKPVTKAPVASKKPSKPDKVYTVKSGDTLTKIARDNKTTIATLKKLNKIKNANLIRVGQVIKLP